MTSANKLGRSPGVGRSNGDGGLAARVLSTGRIPTAGTGYAYGARATGHGQGGGCGDRGGGDGDGYGGGGGSGWRRRG